VLSSESGELLGIPAHQDRLNRHAIPIPKHDSAIIPDGQDRSHQMLAIPHPPGYSIHDHSNRALGHLISKPSGRSVSENVFAGCLKNITLIAGSAQCAPVVMPCSIASEAS
jgi:hypothetical protein